jgi:hypothetical protein
MVLVRQDRHQHADAQPCTGHHVVRTDSQDERALDGDDQGIEQLEVEIELHE